jgi:hypothetical protein
MAGDFSFPFGGDALSIEADDAKFVEVAPFAKGPAVAPIGKLAQAPLLEEAGKDDSHLIHLHDRMQDAVAVKEAEQAGLRRDIERESRLIDPYTGDALTIGHGKATAFDSGFGGRDGVDPLRKGKGSSITDPLTGQPLLGGGGGKAGQSHDDAMAAAMAGKSRAMDDGEVVKDTTPLVGWLTFKDAYTLGTSKPLGTAGSVDGVLIHLTAGTTNEGKRWVAVEYENQPGKTDAHTIVYTEGESWLGKVYKPRPDDDGGAAPRRLTEAEKQAILQELRGSFGPAGQPRPDDEGAGVGRSGGTGEVLTYLDLAGQPRPDDNGHGGGITPAGPVLNDLGLAGQPVDDDLSFGVVTLGVGGLQPPSPGFGGGQRVDNVVTAGVDDGLGT